MTVFEMYKHYGLSQGASGYGPRWGTFHYGVDFPTPVGVAIHTHIDCRLPLSGFYDANRAGYIVMEALDGSHNWLVAHVSEVYYKPGSVVKAGTLVGKTGNTGDSTGPHAHWEYATGRFRGSITANHAAGATIDPLPIIKAALGGGDVMTKEDSFKECFITLAARWPNKAEIDAWKKSGMAAYTWVQRNAPVGYRVDRDKARAERDQARADFAAYQKRVEAEMYQLSKDIISYKVDMEAAQAAQQRAEDELKHANRINAELRATLEEKAQELASQDATEQAEQLFKVAYLTQTGEYPPAKIIEDWKRTDTTADEWVRAHVRNDSIHELQLLLDHANKQIRKLTNDITNHTQNIAELAKRLDGVATQAQEDKAIKAATDKALKEQLLVNEELRSRLAAVSQQTKPIEDWSLPQLVVEVVKRIVKPRMNKTKDEGGPNGEL